MSVRLNVLSEKYRDAMKAYNDAADEWQRQSDVVDLLNSKMQNTHENWKRAERELLIAVANNE